MNQYDIAFVADTAAAVASINRLEAEIKQLAASVQALGTAGSTANASLTGAATAAGAMTTTATAAHGATGQLTTSLLNLSNILQIVGAVAPIAFGFLDKIAEKQQAMAELVDNAMKLKDTLREVANLEGKSGPDNEVAGEVLKLGVDSGMKSAEARQYMEQFLGSSPAGKTKGNITDAVSEQVMTEGARFGSRLGIAAKTAGDFAGVMSQYQKIPNVQAAAKLMGQVAYGLNEGRGNVEPLMRTLLTTAGSVVAEGGPMEDLAELAVMEGVASTHANPYATGNRLRQAVRALRTIKGPEGEWLKKQGVTGNMGHLARLKQVKPELMRMVAGGMGLDQAIKSTITGDDTEARSLAEQIGDIDLMEARLKKARAIDGRDVMQQNEEFLTKNNTGKRRRQKARQEAQEFLMGQANEDMELAMEDERQKLVGEGHFSGNMGAIRETIQDGFGYATGNGKFKDRWALSRATGKLMTAAQEAGMSETEIYGALTGNKDQRDFSNIGENALPGETADQQRKRQRDYYSEGHQFSSLNTNKEAYKRLNRAMRDKGMQFDSSGAPVVAKLDELIKVTKDQAKAATRQNFVGPMPGPAAAAPPARRGNAAAAPRRP